MTVGESVGGMRDCRGRCREWCRGGLQEDCRVSVGNVAWGYCRERSRRSVGRDCRGWMREGLLGGV